MQLTIPIEVVWTAIGAVVLHSIALVRLLWHIERRVTRLEWRAENLGD